MSLLVHPRVVESWRWMRFLLAWIVPALVAWSLQLYVRDYRGGTPALAAAAAIIAAAATAVFVEMYRSLTSTEGDTDGESLAARILWIIPIDIACTLVALLHLVGFRVVFTAWLLAWAVFAVMTVLLAMDAISLPKALPSGTTLAAVGVLLGFVLLARPIHSVALIALLVVIAAAVVGIYLLDFGAEIEDIDAEIARVGLAAFISTCRLVDGPSPTPGHPEGQRLLQALYEPPKRFGAGRIAHVANGTKDPATGQYEYRYLKVASSCRTIQEAVARSYEDSPRTYAPQRRT